MYCFCVPLYGLCGASVYGYWLCIASALPTYCIASGLPPNRLCIVFVWPIASVSPLHWLCIGAVFRLSVRLFGSVRFGSVWFGSVRFYSVQFGSVRVQDVQTLAVVAEQMVANRVGDPVDPLVGLEEQDLAPCLLEAVVVLALDLQHRQILQDQKVVLVVLECVLVALNGVLVPALRPVDESIYVPAHVRLEVGKQALLRELLSLSLP
eukprot:1394371-Amorphochlora_amoeboformis.AAC.2